MGRSRRPPPHAPSVVPLPFPLRSWFVPFLFAESPQPKTTTKKRITQHFLVRSNHTALLISNQTGDLTSFKLGSSISLPLSPSPSPELPSTIVECRPAKFCKNEAGRVGESTRTETRRVTGSTNKSRFRESSKQTSERGGQGATTLFTSRRVGLAPKGFKFQRREPKGE